MYMHLNASYRLLFVHWILNKKFPIPQSSIFLVKYVNKNWKVLLSSRLVLQRNNRTRSIDWVINALSTFSFSPSSYSWRYRFFLRLHEAGNNLVNKHCMQQVSNTQCKVNFPATRSRMVWYTFLFFSFCSLYWSFRLTISYTILRIKHHVSKAVKNKAKTCWKETVV